MCCPIVPWSHLSSCADDVVDIFTRLLNGVLKEAPGLCAHKIAIGDNSFTGDSFDIALDLVQKKRKKSRQDNAEDATAMKSLQYRLNEIDHFKETSFNNAPPVLIIHLQRQAYDEGEMTTKVTSDTVQFGERIQLNCCEDRRAEYSVLDVVCFRNNHYTVTCLNNGNSTWHRYDDESIVKISPSSLKSLQKSDQVTSIIYTKCEAHLRLVSSDRKSPPVLPAFPERRLTETVPENMCLVCPPTQDDNGLIFGPSCTGRCFTTDDECDHEKVKVQLNEVGQYAVFPSLWWHHEYYDIKDEEKVIFTAQLFATPSSDIGSSKRSNRRNSLMNTYRHGQLSTLNGLGEDLFLEWDRKYSADQFPPASKFLGRVDKAKNRLILKHQIHLLPKIERLVFAFEEKFSDITVDSVWLIKKTKQDDGFQEWHQDMKTKITNTIVVNVGIG